MQIAVIGHCPGMGCLGLIRTILERQGIEVVTLDVEPRMPALEDYELKVIAAPPDMQPGLLLRRDRDYPTLREGIRRKQIKSIRRGKK